MTMVICWILARKTDDLASLLSVAMIFDFLLFMLAIVIIGDHYK